MKTLTWRPRGKSARGRDAHRAQLYVETLESRTLLDGALGALVDFGSLVSEADIYASDHVLVQFGADADPASLLPEGVTLGSALPLVDGLYEVYFSSDWTVADAMGALQKSAGVLWVQPDYEVSLSLTPDDTYFSSLWGLNNGSDADIDAPEAWDTATGSGTIIVAIIDSGIDYNHPDLAANIWVNSGEIAGNGVDDDGNGFIDDVHGYDFANNDGDPMDDHSHGTHVAGTIGAVGNNGTGVSGVIWNVQLMGLKFLTSTGSGSTSNAIRALNYAVEMGAHISNNSWGGGGYNQSLFDAIASARSAGHIFVAAAGNNGSSNDTTAFYPANYNLDNVVSVAATDSSNNLASFSNYGANTVDLGAPGVSIYSTLPNNSYGYKSGTSMAAPHVAGALALVWDQHPDWTYSQVIDQVLDTVDTLTSLSGKTITGGRLNLASALAVSATPAPADPTSLAAGSVTSSSVSLTWQDNASNESGYVVERWNGSAWTVVANLGANATSWQNTGLSASTQYSYRVRAYNSGGNSGYSNTLVVTTDAAAAPTTPSAPSNLRASLKSKPSPRATLNWTDNATNETGYRVYRSSDGGATWSQVGSLGANATSFNDSSLSSGASYLYRVLAYNGSGSSAFSNTITLSTGGTSSSGKGNGQDFRGAEAEAALAAPAAVEALALGAMFSSDFFTESHAATASPVAKTSPARTPELEVDAVKAAEESEFGWLTTSPAKASEGLFAIDFSKTVLDWLVGEDLI